MRATESERVDDIPLIVHWLKQMQIEQLIDQELPSPHGNRQGLSYGQLSVLLLIYIITQADHRLCAVEPWVNQHQRILEKATGWKIGSKDSTDDRLADLLAILGSEQHEAIQTIETYLGQHLIRAYELPTDKARSDTTSLSVYHQPREEKIESVHRENKPLLHKGHSKDHRPDLLQYRQMLATLDPVGIPLIGATLAGNGADDPLYFPTWKRLAELIGHLDFLFLADCKASSWSNRAQIDQEGGIYCFPLAMTGHRPKLLFDWVSHPPTRITEILATKGKFTDSPVGQGFELPLGSLWFDQKRQKWHCWSERWLVVQSYALASRQIKGLDKRLLKAEKALAKLAAKPGKDPVVLQTKVAEILQRYRVTKYILSEVKKKINYLKVYEGPGRSGGERPFRRVRQTRLTLTYQRCQEALAEFKAVAGWRLYVTNATVERLSLEESVFAYREQWQTERGFHRFKRGHLPALPIYFQDEQKIRALMFLLTIALRVFTLMEFVVRRQLAREQKSLAGLYEGNPKRTTARPTVEKLLVAFREITFYFHRDGSREVTPLNSLQRKILALMMIPESIYIVSSIHSGATHINRSILCGD